MERDEEGEEEEEEEERGEKRYQVACANLNAILASSDDCST